MCVKQGMERMVLTFFWLESIERKYKEGMGRKIWNGRYRMEGTKRKVWKGRCGKKGIERKVMER